MGVRVSLLDHFHGKLWHTIFHTQDYRESIGIMVTLFHEVMYYESDEV